MTLALYIYKRIPTSLAANLKNASEKLRKRIKNAMKNSYYDLANAMYLFPEMR